MSELFFSTEWKPRERGLSSFQRTKTTIKHGKKSIIVWFIQSPLKWYYIFTWGTAQNFSPLCHRFLICVYPTIGEDVALLFLKKLIFVIHNLMQLILMGHFWMHMCGRGSKGPFFEKLTNLRPLISRGVSRGGANSAVPPQQRRLIIV